MYCYCMVIGFQAVATLRGHLSTLDTTVRRHAGGMKIE